MRTKPENGGALLHIIDALNYKLWTDLNEENEKKPDSIFIEIIQKISKNSITDCIYRYPCMHLKEFNDLFLKSLTERITKENNIGIILLSDFNIDLIKLNLNANAWEFYDVIYSWNLLPHFTSPILLISRSNTLIDNIISNINEEFTSGNIIKQDHLGQFFIIPNCSYSYNYKKGNFQRNFKNFREQNSLLDLKKLDWDTLLFGCNKISIFDTKRF